MADGAKDVIDTRVSPTLAPATVWALDEYDDDTASYFAGTEDVMQVLREGLTQIHDARERVKIDPTLTEAAQVLRVADFAEKIRANVMKRQEANFATLQKQVAFFEGELSQPIQSRAANTISVEVRAYLRRMSEAASNPMDKQPKGDATTFVRKAIEDGDEDTVAAALGAPPYLSGLTKVMQEVLLREWHAKKEPVKAKRLKAVKAAVELYHRTTPILHAEFEKAIGAHPRKISALRSAKTEADRAFVFKNT